ncbi:ShlB/FhaC/HecB family hemolysin secretion/activation protein [Noviherbaspirillum pedocola]|uniref:ShlB/FhaC/HecB family hemolysin secretion/activation protein n=1 Tax=Noviherbaspirillum pedocola TaxID=2801341 RepID=A0A934ST96_9BURK|nr:ShlB/FhaC/HecB family hemolysin secretion/activation protein [Noviherbaspirillum pedocola]MBK4735094.1 ShlB/FhaC/HecB family hemolysin secretion/activation protein [Noviherbaspirillum pedocola]
MSRLVRNGALAACALALTESAWAQVAAPNLQNFPNAGQILRELQQSPPESQTPTLPQQPPETAAPPVRRTRDIQIVITEFRISGNAVIPTDELQALLFDLRGKRVGIGELNEAAERVTRYYHERGYTVAQAYLPAQDVKEGKITLIVLEGKIGKREIRNSSRLSDERAAAYIASRAPAGEVIRGREVDRGLLLLQDTPGVGAARATLAPGADVGSSDLLVEVEPGAAYAGSASVDNFGNRYTGQYRATGALQINSPLRLGDALAATVLTSGRDLGYGRLSYQAPIGADGLRVGAAYAATRYRLGREYAPLDAHGTANSVSVFGSYPLIRSQAANLYASAGLEQRRLEDVVDATSTSTRKRLRVTTLGLAGSAQDSLGGGGISNVDASLASGQLDIESPVALAIDAVSTRAQGTYARLSFNASRVQRLADRDFLWLTFASQWASKNLDSSEKFTLGGPTGVRAYPVGEGIGDTGYLASIEWRRRLNDTLQSALFYDLGSVRINREPFDANANNSRKLGGIGFGFYGMAATADWRASLAWRTSGGAPTSVPASGGRTPQLWLRANLPF